MSTKNKEEAKKTGLNGFQKIAEARESILKQIEEIKAKEDSLYRVICKKKEALNQQRDARAQYKNSLKKLYSKNYNENDLAPHELQQLANYKEDIIALQEDLEKEESQMSALGEKKNALQKTLSGLNGEMTETDVLEYQKTVAAARKAVEDIMMVIENQTSLIDTARSAPSRIDDLKEKKEDILAEIALGKDLIKELDKITGEIETETKLLMTREKTILEAGKSLPGLQRKLSLAKENLNNLENQKNEIFIQYLTHEAEQLGKEYGAAALNLIDKYNRLISLDSLIIMQGGKTIGGGGFHDFSIPAFHLSALSGLISPRMPQELVTARMACTRENKDSAITREKKRINDLGIEL